VVYRRCRFQAQRPTCIRQIGEAGQIGAALAVNIASNASTIFGEYDHGRTLIYGHADARITDYLKVDNGEPLWHPAGFAILSDGSKYMTEEDGRNMLFKVTASEVAR
jgi:hypothetical protein